MKHAGRESLEALAAGVVYQFEGQVSDTPFSRIRRAKAIIFLNSVAKVIGTSTDRQNSTGSVELNLVALERTWK